MRRWTFVALAATVGLVPLVGAMAHSHDHQHAAGQDAHATAVADGPTIAAEHDGEQHRHHPLPDAAVSRSGGDISAAEVDTPLLAVIDVGRQAAPIGAKAGPPPRSKHPPPRSPRAPPLS